MSCLCSKLTLMFVWVLVVVKVAVITSSSGRSWLESEKIKSPKKLRPDVDQEEHSLILPLFYTITQLKTYKVPFTDHFASLNTLLWIFWFDYFWTFFIR